MNETHILFRPYNARVSGEHGRRAPAGTDEPVGNQRGMCRETHPVLTDRAKPVMAARNPFDSIVIRRSTQVTPERRVYSEFFRTVRFEHAVSLDKRQHSLEL